ncbi:hypothetical protein FB451DRAFT_1387294 [Mycena latifolia]|nr:hypothetical protein FB451DRAFT_1387294 [Mycena latifolia]
MRVLRVLTQAVYTAHWSHLPPACGRRARPALSSLPFGPVCSPPVCPPFFLFLFPTFVPLHPAHDLDVDDKHPEASAALHCLFHPPEHFTANELLSRASSLPNERTHDAYETSELTNERVNEPPNVNGRMHSHDEPPRELPREHTSGLTSEPPLQTTEFEGEYGSSRPHELYAAIAMRPPVRVNKKKKKEWEWE